MLIFKINADWRKIRMKLMYRFGKYVMPCLLGIALGSTVAAVFAPYAVEILLGLAVLSLAGFALCYNSATDGKLVWSDYVASLAIALSFLLTLLMIVGGYLQLYTVIEGLNLLVILGISIALLYRKNANRVALCVMIVLSLAVFGFGAYSHLAYKRTIMATVAEKVLASNKVIDSKVAATFQKLTDAGEAPITVKASDFDPKVEGKDFEGMPVLYVNSDAAYEHVIFYIHGGYYVYQMGNEQTALINRLTRQTNSLTVIPMYPLAPFHTAESGHELMLKLYEQVCSENPDKKIILMGDSAGGGYSLALAENLAQHGMEQPDELVLLSPWVDVTMNNPEIADYTEADPMLTITMGRMSGEAWAGSLPTDDWLVSPINGDLSQLKNVSIFVGTRELFYPDDTLLYEKLKDNENVTLHIGQGQNHVYPVYPTLEGRMATETIAEIVRR